MPAVQYRTAIITRGAGALHPETPVARLLKGTPEEGLVLVELHERHLNVYFLNGEKIMYIISKN